MPRYLEPQESPEERQAKRIEKLEHSVKAKLFAEWAKEERQKSPGGRYDDVLWYISSCWLFWMVTDRKAQCYLS